MQNHYWTTTLLSSTKLLTAQELASYCQLGNVLLNIQNYPSCERLYIIPKGAGYSASHQSMAFPELECRESPGRSMCTISRPSSSTEHTWVEFLLNLRDSHLQAKWAFNQPRSCLIQGQLVLPTSIHDAVSVWALHLGLLNSFPRSSYDACTAYSGWHVPPTLPWILRSFL